MREAEKKVFSEFCIANGMEISDFKIKDPPDFVHKNGLLGIELVEYHYDYDSQGSLQRKKEGDSENVINTAKKLYEKNEDLNMNVFFFPNRRTAKNLSKSDKNNLAKEISELVLLNKGQEKSLELPKNVLNYFVKIEIYPTPNYETEMLWQVIEAAYTDVLPETLNHIIEKKEVKLNEYKKYTKEVWLVIYSSPVLCVGSPEHGGRPSTCGHISSELRNSFKSLFDKVFFFDRETQKYLELSTF